MTDALVFVSTLACVAAGALPVYAYWLFRMPLRTRREYIAAWVCLVTAVGLFAFGMITAVSS